MSEFADRRAAFGARIERVFARADAASAASPTAALSIGVLLGLCTVASGILLFIAVWAVLVGVLP